MGEIEQALRDCGDAEVGAAAGLLDEVRRRMFGFAPPDIRLGRYRVLAKAGAGGGGVVVRAEDPRLGRPVAIKLVHSHDRRDDEGARRLLREARVLARLSHPDIVTIYDVGRIDAARDAGLARIVGAPVDGSVFLVMEWLDGGDLSQWLAAAPRRWPEIVDAFVAAGRGLAAAHAAGVLHRDFKPANVLLDGEGRPRVGDFGLGRHDTARTDPDDDDATRHDSITRRDHILGTPLYMAPEQHLGKAVDARSDQYSFCFALHEALYGDREFSSMKELVRSKLAGPPRVQKSAVPVAIERVLARGLAPDRAQRWPTMPALLTALARARRPRSVARSLALLAAPALLLVAAVRIDAPFLCSDDDPSWSAVWGQPRREIADAFTSRASGFGHDSFTAVDERMSALGHAWVDARTQVCAVRSEAGASCLDRQRRRAAALVDAWRGAARDGIAGAAREAERLDDPRDCVIARSVASTPAVSPELARVEALVAAGRIAEAAELADRVPLTTARERVVAADAFDRNGRYADAERELVAAVHEAEGNDDDATLLAATTRLVAVVGSHLVRPDDGEQWARHAWATLARVDDDGTRAADVHEALGMLALGNGQWPRALEHFDEALRLGASARAEDELRRAANLANAAGAMVHLGRYPEAIERLEEAIEIQRARLGEGHPGLAMTRHNLAAALGSIGRIDRARDEATKALDAWTVAYGERHPDVAMALQTLGSLCRSAGELDRAIELGEKARALRIELLGPDHPDTTTSELNLANAYEAAGRLPEAIALLERVVVTHDQDPAISPSEGIAWLNLGSLQIRAEDFDAAARSLVRAREPLLATHGSRHPSHGMRLLNLGVVQRERDDLDASLASLDDAEAVLREQFGESHPRVSSVYLERGRTWLRRGDEAAARADYVRAIETLEGVEHAEAERDLARAALAELDR